MIPAEHVPGPESASSSGSSETTRPVLSGRASSSGAFFQSLVEISTDGLALIQVEGTILYTSPAITPLLGYADDELVGQNFFELIHPEHLPFVLEQLKTILSDPAQTARAEILFRSKDGSWKWLEGTGRNLLDVPPLCALVISYHDISKQRRIEEALRHSENRFNAFLDHSPSAAWMKDANLRYVFTNRMHLQRFGSFCTDWLGRSDYEIWPDFADQLRQNDQAVLASLSPIEVIESVPVEGQETRHCLVCKFPFRDAQGRLFVGGFAVDITERLQAEEALRDSEARYRLLFDSVPIPVLMYDAESLRILDVNASAVSQYGFSRDEFAGMTIDDLRPDGAPGGFTGSPHTAEAHRLTDMASQQHRTRDGRLIYVETTICPFDLEGQRARLCVAQDVTARRETEIKLKQTEEQFRQSQKMEAIGRLAGGIAHDFNNFLTIVRGLAAELESGLDPSSPLAARAGEIVQAAERAAGLTKQLLVVSRRQISRPQTLDLNAVVSSMERLLRPLIGEDVALQVRTAPEAAWITADATQLEQVIMNLAVNARDAMPEGGRLLIETTRYPSGSDGSSNAHRDASVRLRVTDTGCGMDETVRARVFEPFFTTKEFGQGSGLGLATVYAIARQCGGAIHIDSEPGRGTTVTIDFPCAAPPPAQSAAIRDDNGGAAQLATILLVEDEEMVRYVARSVLQRAGHTVLPAGDGEEALAIAARHPDSIDLVLTDVTMPGISGPQLAGRLLADRPGLKVLFMSGYAGEASGVSAEQFLEKPFSPESLRKAVDRALIRPSRILPKPT